MTWLFDQCLFSINTQPERLFPVKFYNTENKQVRLSYITRRFELFFE